MSWKDAIEDIVTEMQEEIDDLKKCGDLSHHALLKGYMSRLKSVLKAAGDTTASSAPSSNSFFNPMLITPEIQRAAEVDKYRAEFKNKNAQKEEALDGNMVELVDTPGEEGSSYHPIDPSMPIGARTLVAGMVYQLKRRSGKLTLVYDEVATQNAVKELKEEEPKSAGGIILGN